METRTKLNSVLIITDDYESETPTEKTANPPLPTSGDELSIAEQIAKDKIEAILEAIEKTNFITLTGGASGMHGCIEIEKLNGDKTWVGENAFFMITAMKNPASFVEKHKEIKEIAKHAISPKRNNAFFRSLTRTNEASELYRRIAYDEIKPKNNKNRVYRV